MSKQSSFKLIEVSLIGAFCVLSLALPGALAQSMHKHDGHAAHQQGPQVGQQHQAAAPAGNPTPHGGRISVAGPLRFEVVYLPQEIRVYLYDASNRPISARGAAGQVAMTVQGNEKVYRYPLAHVATGAGSRIQDYLAATVNVSRIKDGDMTVAFELTNLPRRDLPRARFTQTFALSKIPVTLAALNEADRAGIARQKVCPVMGGRLGGMGTPVKVLLGDQPIYLCCKGCLGKIQKNPAAYLPKSTPAQTGNGAATSNKLTVSTSTSADRTAIARQRVCVVAGSRLGGMGTPVKVTLNGQSLFLCCKGCVGKVEKDPAGYFAKAAQLHTGR